MNVRDSKEFAVKVNICHGPVLFLKHYQETLHLNTRELLCTDDLALIAEGLKNAMQLKWMKNWKPKASE